MCNPNENYSITEHTAVSKIFHPLLALVASATDSELAKYVEYLKEENKILRARLPKQIHTTPDERKKLVRLGKQLGRAIEELITIVSPSTFYRWCREGVKSKKQSKGRPRKCVELRDLVIKIAKETGFGYTRIIGELRKLGITKISRNTVRNILKEEGMEPGPDRTSDAWDKFLKRHGDTLWGCDFFSVRTVTAKGLRELYLLVFLCLKTREVIISPSTEHPNSEWVCEQTEAFPKQTAAREHKPTHVMHDRDVKFTKDFAATLKAEAVKPNPLPKGSPNLNGRVERFVKTIREECLSKFILFGKRHLDYIADEFCDYYNNVRSHSSRESLPPIRVAPGEVDVLSADDIVIRSHVAGIVKSIERKAA